MDVSAQQDHTFEHTLKEGLMNRSTPVLIGIVSAAVAGSVVAQSSRSVNTRLIAPDERAWFDRQPSVVRKKIMADLQTAKACISAYGNRDGSKEAMAAAGLPRPKFYTGISNGVVVYRTVPGIKGCSPGFATASADQLFIELPQAYSGPFRMMRIQILCGEAASHYAAAFNRTLAVIKPDAFHAACPMGEREVD